MERTGRKRIVVRGESLVAHSTTTKQASGGAEAVPDRRGMYPLHYKPLYVSWSSDVEKRQTKPIATKPHLKNAYSTEFISTEDAALI